MQPVCRQTVELLPWFLHAALPSGEGEAVRAHLEVCAACRSEEAHASALWPLAQSHLPPAVLMRFAFGEPLGGSERIIVESHVARCPECAADLDLLGPPAARAERPSSAGPLRGYVQPRWPWAAVALVAIALTGWWLSQRALDPTRREASVLSHRLAQLETQLADRGPSQGPPEAGARAELETAQAQLDALGRRLASLEAPHANLAVVELYSTAYLQGLRGAAPAAAELRLPRGEPFVALILFSERDPRQGDHVVELRNAASKLLWRTRGLRPSPDGRFTLLVPTKGLTPGLLHLRLFDESGSRPEPVGDYVAQLRAPEKP